MVMPDYDLLYPKFYLEMVKVVDYVLHQYNDNERTLVSNWTANEQRLPDGRTIVVYLRRGRPEFYTVVWFENSSMCWKIGSGAPADYTHA